MISVIRALAVILSPIALVGTVDGTKSTGANVAPFEALCGIIALAKSAVKVPAVTNSHIEQMNKVRKLNMSVSDPTWRIIFHKNGKPNEYNDDVPQGVTKGDDWEAQWQAWKQAEQALEKENEDTDIAAAGLETASQTVKALARPRIAAIAARAAIKVKSIKEDPQTTEALTDSKVQTLLRTAAFGSDVNDETEATLKSLFGGEALSNRGTVCEASLQANKAQTAGAAIACLCLDSNTNNIADICHHAATGGAHWNGANPNLGQIQAHIARCRTMPNEVLTGSKLQSLIKAITSRISLLSGDGYLVAVNSACSGTTATGSCVKFPGYKANPQQATSGLQWLGQLQRLAEQLKEREDMSKKAEEATRILKEYITTINFIVDEAKTTRGAVAQTAAEQQGGGNAKQKQKTNVDCTTFQKNETCTAAGCKWESITEKTENHCKPKDGEGQTNAAGGTGPAVTAGTPTASTGLQRTKIRPLLKMTKQAINKIFKE
ncbi:Trypanosomal VSG domain containing protein, putative [Trypanosoma equiperdum]|uniref:Trypanosomal VSG domain containing protein, putative n=1 Tax=Trypanosoma equiperdum TaxID=5694 RepID=A0A1G4IIZ2_TRYEQ|nr:Trypanosomal VSG domain containing protein, putative [Trypanosoma equiperdum]